VDVSDLSEFVLARIEEDEVAARMATPARWKLWGMDVMADTSGDGTVDGATLVAGSRWVDKQGRPRTWNANHIIRWQPERALAECKAKRRTVELYGQIQERQEWQDQGARCMYLILCDLAAVYADHPDYNPAWRP
jgi:hypothetical protein